MSYYNYHAVATNLIKTGHCTHTILKEKHNKISPALVLYFNNHPPMPIRKESFEKYIFLLKFYDIPILNQVDKI